MANHEAYKRKATSRKAKQLLSMNGTLDGDDWQNRQVLTGRMFVPRKPPFGKTWVKQLFSASVGLTLLCAAAGMLVGTPLAYEEIGWNPGTTKGRGWLHHDLKMEDPYLTVLTPSPFDLEGWSLERATKRGPSRADLEDAHATSDKSLRLIGKTIKDRIAAKRHVLFSIPASHLDYLDRPSLALAKKQIEEGHLFEVKSELAEENNVVIYTTMLAAESTLYNNSLSLGGCLLRRAGKGENTKDKDEDLAEAVANTMVQQAAVETTALHEIHDSFPSEVRTASQGGASSSQQGGPKRRRYQPFQRSVLTDQFEAPPVYIRPDTAEPAIDPGERVLAELLDDPAAAEDDAGYRAERVAELDPVLSTSEVQRRDRWMKVSPDLRKCLRDLHVNFGHPTNVTLQRILRRQGAKQEAIRAVDFLSCDTCGDTLRRKRPKPVRLPSKYVFNAHLQLDVFYAKDASGTNFSFLNIVCDATGFQVVSCLGESQGPPSTRAILRHFLTSWSSWAGLPESVQVDRGKEYLAVFSDYLKDYGVEQEVMPLEAPWKNGRVERAGGLWKEIFAKVTLEMNVQGLQDVITAASIVTQCRNSFPWASGYSPNQWVLGKPDVRLPGSLLLDEEAERLEVLESAEDPTSAMARALGMRESAKVAQVRLDTDGRVRRALLRQSTPTRGPFPVGSYVYFYRWQQQPGVARNVRWHGPARVIGLELRNQRRSADPELPTDGGQPHSYWLRYGPSVVLVTGEQLRFASEDELLAAHMVPQEALEPPYARGARNYVDLRGHRLAVQPDQGDAPQELPQPQRRGQLPNIGVVPGTAIPGRSRAFAASSRERERRRLA